MDSTQLQFALLKSVKGNVKVCASNQLRFIDEGPFAIICNNEPDTQAGMHCLGLYSEPNSTNVEFFDSFAMPIEFYGEYFTRFCERMGKTLTFSKCQLQSNFSSYCGQYCLYFLIHRSRGSTFPDIIQRFSDNLQENDRIVSDFVKQHFRFPNFSECKDYCNRNCTSISSECLQRNHHCTKLHGNLHKCRRC